jgi:hypothetical protein
MKNQLPTRPFEPGAARAWGHRSRYFERERVTGQHVALDIAVYRVILWGHLMYQRPASCYSLVLN